MAQENDNDEYVTEKMYVTRRKDSHYSNSRKKPGEFSPLTRSEVDAELDQVTLRHVEEDEESFAYDDGPVRFREEPEPPRRSKEQEELEELARKVVRELLIVAIEYGAPYAKRLWIEKLHPAFRTRAERRREHRALLRQARAQLRQHRAEKSSSVIEARMVEPSQDIAALAEVKPIMASSEAQARHLMALAAQRFAEEQMRLLAAADIRADEGFQELEHALSELSPEQVVKMLQRFEAAPSLLAGNALTGLGVILGVERADGPSPLEDAASPDRGSASNGRQRSLQPPHKE
ncbi:hypothetical protein [Actinomadura luteofluorescens]|uniref:hypothetical protein n=1 Tax=Actinomadura luteofluorescens TaxID=46163 RepID=UPI003D8F7798